MNTQSSKSFEFYKENNEDNFSIYQFEKPKELVFGKVLISIGWLTLCMTLWFGCDVFLEESSTTISIKALTLVTAFTMITSVSAFIFGSYFGVIGRRKEWL
ncbi:MAG: hypothetical protein QM791_13770 [Ferruginibacter sp.]